MALVESLMLSSSALPASKFSDAYNELMTFDVKAKCLGIARDFEVYNFSYVCMWTIFNIKIESNNILVNHYARLVAGNSFFMSNMYDKKYIYYF